jgi:Xaa-Pro aminopeptidase
MSDHEVTVSDGRLVRFLEEVGADGLISADPGVVRMLTGHAHDIETGPPVFALPPIVVAGGGSAAILVCSTDEALAGDDVIAYAGCVGPPSGRVARAGRAVADAIHRSAAAGACWAVDGGSVPAAVLSSLGGGWRTVDAGTTRLTAVKTATEVAAIEAAVAVCDVGIAAARDALLDDGLAGELDLWQRIRRAMEAHVGARISVQADVVSGARASQIGGPPTTRAIGPGDLVIVDLVPRVAGFWGDSCVTLARGTPTPEQRAAHAAASEALEIGKGMLRPGTRSGDVDSAMRAALRPWGDFPHHAGHGVGFSSHEEPRIVPQGVTTLEPGMVVALEPGVYAKDWGLRVEQVCVVTETGSRVVSGHSLAL